MTIEMLVDLIKFSLLGIVFLAIWLVAVIFFVAAMSGVVDTVTKWRKERKQAAANQRYLIDSDAVSRTIVFGDEDGFKDGGAR